MHSKDSWCKEVEEKESEQITKMQRHVDPYEVFAVNSHKMKRSHFQFKQATYCIEISFERAAGAPSHSLCKRSPR